MNDPAFHIKYNQLITERVGNIIMDYLRTTVIGGAERYAIDRACKDKIKPSAFGFNANITVKDLYPLVEWVQGEGFLQSVNKALGFLEFQNYIFYREEKFNNRTIRLWELRDKSKIKFDLGEALVHL